MSNDSVINLCGQNKKSRDLLTDAGVTSTYAELNLLDGVTEIQAGEVCFYHANCTANTVWSMATNAWGPNALTYKALTGMPMQRDGSVRGFSVMLTAALATATDILRVGVQKQTAAGTASTLVAMKTLGTGVQFYTTNFALGSYTFDQGERIGVRIHTHSDFNAANDVFVSVAYSY